MNIRIGNGYDVHKLVENRKLILGGVLIPHKKGLLGHSDADVLCHAIIDSLLGATKNGDIGVLFPDTNDKFKDISSIKLLKQVGELIKKSNYNIVNIDTILVVQEPKIMPFVKQIEDNICNALCIDKSQINVKATTEEGLGFTGEMLGISANAVCLVEKQTI